jgi:hypothetical protein
MLVKTYPIPSHKYEETVCCAGIDAMTRDWIRMYPVNFRSLAEYARFKKWQFIEATWSPATADSRPESRKVHQDSIQAGEFLGSQKGWPERMRWLEPLIDASLETLKTENARTGKSIGAIRPKRIKRLIIRDAARWDQLATRGLVQLSLDWNEGPTPRGDLEQLPYDFLYQFECDDPTCPGNHEMEIFDWELGQAYRNFRRKYGKDGWESKLRQKYERDLPGRDLILLMGTHHRWKSWLIVGVVAPPKAQMREGQRRSTRHRIGQDESMTIPWLELETQEGNRRTTGESNHVVNDFRFATKRPLVGHTEEPPPR